MEFLPDLDEQGALITHISKLIEVMGSTHFLESTVLEPTSKHFPFEVTSSGNGAFYIAEYLLKHIGLSAVTPEIYVYKPDEEDDSDIAASVTYNKKKRKCCIYINEQSLSDLNYLAAVIAHEVTHVYREHHNLAIKDHEEEELLTDLTAVYLGFGVLLTKASYLAYSYGDTQYHYWGTRTLGYLSPQSLCFLLSIQAVLRGVEKWREIPYRKHVGSNQQAFLKTSLNLFLENEDALKDLKSYKGKTGFPSPELYSSETKPNVVFDSSIVPETNIVSSEAPQRQESSIDPIFQRMIGIGIPFIGFLIWISLCMAIEETAIRTVIVFIPLIWGAHWGLNKLFKHIQKKRDFYRSIDRTVHSHETCGFLETRFMQGGGIGMILGVFVSVKGQDLLGGLLAFLMLFILPALGLFLGSKLKYFVCLTEDCHGKIKFDQDVCVICNGKLTSVREFKGGYVEYTPIDEFRNAKR